MISSSYNGTEKRTYIRIAYRTDIRPKLNIGNDFFEVVDVSESGIRVVNDKNIKLDKRILGTMTLLCGASVAIEGDVVWNKNGEFGLLLKHLIPPDDMEKEKKYVILKLATY